MDHFLSRFSRDRESRQCLINPTKRCIFVECQWWPPTLLTSSPPPPSPPSPFSSSLPSQADLFKEIELMCYHWFFQRWFSRFFNWLLLIPLEGGWCHIHQSSPLKSNSEYKKNTSALGRLSWSFAASELEQPPSSSPQSLPQFLNLM